MVADVAPQTQRKSWDVAANSGNVEADQYAAGSAGISARCRKRRCKSPPRRQACSQQPGGTERGDGEYVEHFAQPYAGPVHAGRDQRDHAWG